MGAAAGGSSSTAVEVKLPEEQEARRDVAEQRLWWLNLVMGGVHLVWAIVGLSFGTSDSIAGNFRVLAISTYPDWTSNVHAPLASMQQRHWVPLVSLASGFAWMSAMAHLLVVTLFDLYIYDLRRGVNRIRCLEFAASTSLMLVTVAMLLGVWDVHTQFLIGTMNTCAGLFTYAHELQNSEGKSRNWTNLASACFAFTCAWVVIVSYAHSAGKDGVPNFVWAIFATTLVFSALFPGNSLLQYAQIGAVYRDQFHGFPGGGLYFGEMIYQVLSLASKTLLLWLIIGGTSQDSSVIAGGG